MASRGAGRDGWMAAPGDGIGVSRVGDASGASEVGVAAGAGGVAVGAAGPPQASVTANARSAIGARRAMLFVLSQNTEKDEQA